MNKHHLTVDQTQGLQFFFPVKIAWENEVNERQQQQEISNEFNVNFHVHGAVKIEINGVNFFSYMDVKPASKKAFFHVL